MTPIARKRPIPYKAAVVAEVDAVVFHDGDEVGVVTLHPGEVYEIDTIDTGHASVGIFTGYVIQNGPFGLGLLIDQNPDDVFGSMEYATEDGEVDRWFAGPLVAFPAHPTCTT